MYTQTSSVLCQLLMLLSCLLTYTILSGSLNGAENLQFLAYPTALQFTCNKVITFSII